MAAVEHEIAAEKAGNLGRVAERLERVLEELKALGAAVESGPAEERPGRVAAFNACRQRALSLYDSLCIQREAMGVRSHELLASLYPIPPKRK